LTLTFIAKTFGDHLIEILSILFILLNACLVRKSISINSVIAK